MARAASAEHRSHGERASSWKEEIFAVLIDFVFLCRIHHARIIENCSIALMGKARNVSALLDWRSLRPANEMSNF